MTTDKAQLLANERHLYWGIRRDAMASSRGSDPKLARQDMEELALFGQPDSSEQLRVCVEKDLR